MTTTRRKTGLARLIELAGGKKWWLISSMLLAVLASLALFMPYVATYVILRELAANAAEPGLINRDLVWRWGFISLGAIAIFGVLQYTSAMLSHIAAFNILYELRIALSRKLARLPLGYFTRRASGDIKKVLVEDVERIELFVAHHIPDVTAAAVFPLLVLGVLTVMDWRLALVVALIFVLAMGFQFSMLRGNRYAARYKAYHDALGRMNASIVEFIRGIQVVKVFSRSAGRYERLRHDITAFRDFSIDMTYSFAPTYTGFLTLLSSTMLFLVPAAVLLLLRSASYADYVPTVLLFLILGGGVFFPLLNLLFMGSLLKQNTMGVELIDAIFDKPEIPEPAQPQSPRDASVEFRAVSFAYDEKAVLREVSFTAAPGTVTALVGPSGAGKSTIGMLSARFWDVGGGTILIGGVPISKIGSEELMRHVAFVFQDSMLFFDTIEENIRMGNTTASLAEVMEAARAAQCHEFIEQLPNGYATLVGEGGTYLSGGEQQRISLARAILRNAPIVVLDEATAYADPENEGKILASFSRLIQGKTVLVIAHRLSTITSADQILVIDSGMIAEQGRHAELVARDGLYSQMWRTYSQAREWVLEARPATK